MALTVGSRLGHYDVTALIGEGGMGQVYQATDTKLNRQVALKILPEAFATDPDRLARFQREAQVLASLNHPGIAAIYGLEESGDTRALVLELVEGATLGDRIAQGAIPLDEALPIAKQIAEALEAAHEAGVIHRDLKPANIKVKDDGTVKVLDFGLAKALDTTPQGDPSQSPTLTAAATQMGVIMGTAAYMSPEQARGKTVDKRADVWAFGCVLFEMLTGRRVFEASDVSEVLALVLLKDPDLTSVPTDVPEAVRTLLGRCLTKNPKDRLRDIGEARVALRDASSMAPATATGSASSVAAAPSAAAQFQRETADRRSLAIAISASVIVTAVVTGFAVWSLQPSNPREVSRFTYEIPPETPLRITNRNVIAASPDGRQFVYNTAEGLHLRSLDQLESRLLPGTEETLGAPFFSPDGQSVGFRQGSQLKRILLSGGAPVVIAESTSPPVSASWAADGTIFFADDDGIKRVPAAGGTPDLVVAAAEGEELDVPQLLPDGDTVLFSVAAAATRGIARRWDNGTVTAQSLSSGERVDLIEGGGSDARYIPTGHIVYALDDGLFAVAFSLDSLTVLGGPVSLVERVARTIGDRVSSANYAVADNGTLFYLSGGGEANSSLVWVDRNGAVDVLDTVPPNVYESPRLSPDDQRLLVVADGAAWIYDLASGRETRVTSDGQTTNYAGWTPSGDAVAYSASGPDGTQNIWMTPADGGEEPRQLTALEGQVHFDQFSPNGPTISAHHHGSRSTNLLTVSLETPDAEPEKWFGRDSNDSDTVFSPDGRYVAHVSNRTGQREIVIQPFSGPGPQTPASVGGGREPAWARNGELFYRRPSDYAMMAVTVSTEPTLTVGQPRMLFPGGADPQGSPRARYAVTSDGQRFLMSARWLSADDGAAEGAQVNIVLNWVEELRQRVPIP